MAPTVQSRNFCWIDEFACQSLGSRNRFESSCILSTACPIKVIQKRTSVVLSITKSQKWTRNFSNIIYTKRKNRETQKHLTCLSVDFPPLHRSCLVHSLPCEESSSECVPTRGYVSCFLIIRLNNKFKSVFYYLCQEKKIHFFFRSSCLGMQWDVNVYSMCKNPVIEGTELRLDTREL